MRRASDRLNEHGREEVGDHTADEEPHQYRRIGHGEVASELVEHLGGHEMNVLFASNGDDRDEAGEQRHRRDHGGANGDAFGFGLGRVADRVEVCQDLASRLGSRIGRIVAHLSDAVGVVRDRTEHVHGNGISGEGEHADAGHGHAVGDEQRWSALEDQNRQANTEHEHERDHDRALESDREAADDVRGVTSFAGLGQGFDRLVVGVGVVAGHLVQNDGQKHTDETGEYRPHVETGKTEVGPQGQSVRITVREAGSHERVRLEIARVEAKVDDAEAEETGHTEDGPDPEATMDTLKRGVRRGVGLGTDRIGRDDRAEDADATDEQGEDDSLMPERGETQDHGRHNGDLVRLEHVGRHAGAVANIVTDVVGDGGGVARIIFRNVLLDLADEVCSDVRGLGVDATAHAHEECEQRATEAEAEQRLVGSFAEGEEDERATEEPETVREHARDRTGAVTEDHGFAIALGAGGRGHPQVAERCQLHAGVPDQE